MWIWIQRISSPRLYLWHISSSFSYYSLAKQPDIAVSVDLLVVLLADEDSAVRKAALEVYLRRVYRAHTIMTLSIADEDGIISAEWSFTTR